MTSLLDANRSGEGWDGNFEAPVMTRWSVPWDRSDMNLTAARTSVLFVCHGAVELEYG